MMKENHVSVSQYDSIDNVEKRMRKLKNSKYLAMKVVNTRTIFHEMIGKAKHKASQRAQKRGEYLDDFMALLQEKRVNQLLE